MAEKRLLFKEEVHVVRYHAGGDSGGSEVVRCIVQKGCVHSAYRGESCCQVHYCKRCGNQNQIRSPASSLHFVGNRTNTQSGVMFTQNRLKRGPQPRVLPGNLSLRCHFFLESGVRVGLWEAGGCKASFPFWSC